MTGEPLPVKPQAEPSEAALKEKEARTSEYGLLFAHDRQRHEIDFEAGWNHAEDYYRPVGITATPSAAARIRELVAERNAAIERGQKTLKLLGSVSAVGAQAEVERDAAVELLRRITRGSIEDSNAALKDAAAFLKDS